MKYYAFSLEAPVKYNLTGKFQAPSQEWTHFTRTMMDYELIVVTEGTVYIQLDQQQYSVAKGECLLCPPTSKQSGFKRSSCAFYWLHFSCMKPVNTIEAVAFPEQTDGENIVLPSFGRISNLEKIIVMMKQLQDSVRSYHHRLQNNYLCTSILCEIYCQYIGEFNHASADLKRSQLFNDIQDYVKWYSSSDLKVSEIAEHFSYDKRYISSLFHSISGITLKQYITKEKIEAAKYLLCDTNDDINAIAYNIGFNDSHNFMKVFKKLTGLTPTQYRNAYASRLLFYK